MDAFSTAELSSLQATQVESLQDTCVLQSWSSGSADAYGQRVETWTDGAALACGYKPTGGREVWGVEDQPIIIDATVRLPIATVVNRKDRVRVTHRFGVELDSAEVFEIIGEPRRGPSGLQLDLRRVTL